MGTIDAGADSVESVLEEAEAEAAEAAAMLTVLAGHGRRRKEAMLRLPAGTRRLFFKAVARAEGGRLVSVFDGATEYQLGRPTGEATDAPLAPRYFAYATPGEAAACPFPEASQIAAGHAQGGCADPRTPVVVLIVVGLGVPEYHGRGKFSFSSLLPVAIAPNAVWRNPRRWR